MLARDLLGRYVVRELDGRRLILRIVETEAYLGEGDRASHAWRGTPTKRTETLFRAGGCAYVYLIYGIHHMLNVVAGPQGDGQAVLIRAGEPVENMGAMKRLRGLVSNRPEDLASGPGKLCKALKIDRGHDGELLTKGELRIGRGRPLRADHVVVGPRVGVDYAGEAASWPLRFAELRNRNVSRPYPWSAGRR